MPAVLSQALARLIVSQFAMPNIVNAIGVPLL
jgi:hypothetical protein